MKEVTYSFYIDKKFEKKTKIWCGRKYFRDVDLHVEILENTIVLPANSQSCGGVLYNGEVLPQSTLHRGSGGFYKFEETDVIDSEEEVVYIGTWHPIWGHCLTDNVKHLWFLFHPEYDYLKKFKWVYTLLNSGSLNENHNIWQLFKIWGINIGNIYRIEKPTRYRRVFLPDDSLINTSQGKLYTKEYARLFSNSTILTPKIEIPLYDRIYLTRTNLVNAKDYGEKSIEDAFRKMGYQVMSPENMELNELICVLRHCKVLATTVGSISHNALFLNEGTKLVLIRKAYYVNGYQLTINELKKLQVVVIDSHKSISVDKATPWMGPFFLYCGKNLKKFAPEVKYGGFPLKSFFVYLKKTKYLKKYFKELLKKSWFYKMKLKLTNFGSDKMS